MNQYFCYLIRAKCAVADLFIVDARDQQKARAAVAEIFLANPVYTSAEVYDDDMRAFAFNRSPDRTGAQPSPA